MFRLAATEKATRTYVNLFTVFLLCGLWHGAALTFIVWGIYHGLLLTIERLIKTWLGWTPKGVPGIIIAGVLVTIGWVPFRAATVGDAGDFLAAMFNMHAPSVIYYPLSYYATPVNLTYLALWDGGCLVSDYRLRELVLTEPLLHRKVLGRCLCVHSVGCHDVGKQLPPLHLFPVLDAYEGSHRRPSVSRALAVLLSRPAAHPDVIRRRAA